MRIPEQKHMEQSNAWLEHFVRKLKNPNQSIKKPVEKTTVLQEKKASDNSNSDKVHAYLRKNYPAETLEWVKNTEWQLQIIPLANIQMERRPGGAREQEKVKRIAEAFKSNDTMEPVVLVRLPEGKMKIADGYHRTLGCRHAGKKSIKAWVGKVKEQNGPWDKEMHEKKLNKTPVETEKTAAVMPAIKGIGSFLGNAAKSTAKEVGDYGRGISGVGVRKAKKNLNAVQQLPNVTKTQIKDAKGVLKNERINTAKSVGYTGLGLTGAGIGKMYQMQKEEQKNNPYSQ